MSAKPPIHKVSFRIPVLLVILLLILPLSAKASDINVWYGDVQKFGEIGHAQRWVNILGHVSEPESIEPFTLSYSLEGVPTVFSLSVGPDGRRLNDAGDFNVEIDFTNLASGANNVIVEARDQSNNIITSKTVTVNKYDNIWPIPYSIDWFSVGQIQDVAQIVDGYWIIDTDGVRSIQPGYDRIIAIGDDTWTDYEVTVPITINGIDEDAFNPLIYPYSVGPGIGIILRWHGHVDALDGSQPTWGWWETGSSSWYEFLEDGQGGLQGGLFLAGDGFYSEDPYGRTLDFGVSYIWKMRVQTIAGVGSLYSSKLWESGQSEPQEWQMAGLVDSKTVEYLENGSFLLIAHHVDGTFGDVSAMPVEDSNIPVIRDVDVTIAPDETEATITWTTNVMTTGQVSYGLTDTYGLTVSDNTPGTNHSVTLTNLQPDTIYYYLITATSVSGGFVSEYIPQKFGNRYNLLMSVSPDRSGSVSLDNQIVSGIIYVFTGPDAGVKRVSFSLDGVAHREENYAPYDYDGTAPNGQALPTGTTLLSDGEHQITATITRTDGSTEPPITATFTVDNGGPPVDTDGDGVPDGQDRCPGTPTGQTVDDNGCTAAQRDADSDGYEWILVDGSPGPDCNDTNPLINPGATEVCDGVDNDCDGQIDEGCSSYNLRMSVSPDRSGYVSLNNQIVSGIIYVFTGPDTGVKRVSFSLDGVSHRVENIAPYDYDGTAVDGGALPTDTTLLSDGVHQITATITRTDGSTEPPITATFTVDNGGPPVDTDNDGVPDGQDLCPDTPIGEPVNLNGCSAAQADLDGDGYPGRFGYTEDCNDADPAINPGAAEVCGDGVDNNCDGQIDEGCVTVDTDGDGVPDGQDLCPDTPIGEPVNLNGCSAAQADLDGDGYPGSFGYTEDCNDADPAINPGAAEVCGDGVDNNCDGQIDEGCSSYNLLMSVSPDRSGSVSLDGQIVSGIIYVFTGPDAGVMRVSFSLDGVVHRVENIAPYDYDGTASNGGALPTDTTLLGDGEHQITATITRTDGSTEPPITATFTVDNGGSTDPQLRAEIGPDQSYVILENSQIYVKYAPYYTNHNEFAIKEFRIKSAANENQVGIGLYKYLDADSGRGALFSASIVYSGTDRKTVRLIWVDEFNDPTKKITQEVTIFGNSRYLKINYSDVQYGINVVDLGTPGGTTAGTHVAYGHSGWNRGYITFQDPSYFGSYYNRYPPDGVNDPTDGGSLNYNGNFIVGVYNSSNGRGFARVMPVADISIIKLLLYPSTRRGLELFPHPFLQTHLPFTGYLYVVTGGESEILSVGKQLADGN